MKETYWILASEEEDSLVLKEMGIIVGQWSELLGEFTGCEIPDEAMDKLDSEFGQKFVWGPE